MLFVYELKFKQLPSSKDKVHVFIYIKQKNAKRFYKQKSRDFVKSKTISVTFIYTRIRTLYVTQFSMSFLKLRDYLYKNARHFAKIKTICVTFCIQKPRLCALHDLSLNFWNWRRVGGAFFYLKTMHFALNFYMQKNALCVTFLYLNFII